jgi:hypothetical protein
LGGSGRRCRPPATTTAQVRALAIHSADPMPTSVARLIRQTATRRRDDYDYDYDYDNDNDNDQDHDYDYYVLLSLSLLSL